MVKAWLIIFILSSSPNEDFLGKIEIPYQSMNGCVKAKTDLSFENDGIKYQFICVTDDHHSGRSVDPGVPLD